jgi:Zn-dependent protease
MRFEHGALTIARLGRVTFRLHWTLPVSLFVFSGLTFDWLRWTGLLAVMLGHTLGHLAMVKAAGARATAFTVGGLGGRCEWEGQMNAISRATIAWGGVWAQLLLLVAGLGLSYVQAPMSALQLAMLSVVVSRNAVLIAANLLPLAPFDGGEAWVLPLLLGRRVRDRLARRPAIAPIGLGLADGAFDAGDRAAEVSAMVSSMLEAAKREEP